MRGQTPVLRGDPGIWASMAQPGSAAGKTRRRRYRRLLRVTIALAALFGAWQAGRTAWAFLYTDSAFALRRVIVEGAPSHDLSDPKGRMEDLLGRNLVRLRQAEVARRLAPYGWLKGFVCRKHLPDTLVVELQERQRLCALSAAGGVIEVDGAGHAWPASPGITGVFGIGEGLDPSSPALQRLVAELLRMELSGKVLAVEQGTPGACVLRTREGWAVRVSLAGGLSPQWGRFEKAREWVEKNLPGRKALDVRWEGKVVVEAANG